MAKEQVRKRGKRKPKNVEEEYPKPVPHAPVVGQDTSAGPSFHPSRAALLSGQKPSFPIPTFPPGSVGEEINSGVPDINPDYPFGQLDPDLKAYFRTVEDQIKDWEGISSSGEEREDRQTFLSSVLTELRDHELVVATDPETSIVLERLLPSLGDWGRRVIGDAFGEQWTVLLRHRFGSHVVQTWLTLAGDTLDRESKNMFPPQHHAQAEHPELGILPTMSTLLSSLLSEIIPNLSTLISDTHSSPPIRLLFLLLSPDRPLPSLEERDEKIRSKRSGKFRKNQGVKGMSIFGEELGEEKGKGKSVNTRFLPTELVGARKRSRKTLMESVKEGEWKILGVHPVGSIVVQMMLEFENEEDEAEKPGSLFDILTEGMITQIQSEEQVDPQAFMTSLQTSPTGTRLYEALLLYSPWPIFQAIWKTYFVGNIGKLSIHPFANFVVSKGISRLGAEEMEGVIKECVELQGGTGMIKTQRTSVLQALAERATNTSSPSESIISLVISSLGLPETDQSTLVPCLMALKTHPTYHSILTGDPLPEDEVPVESKDASAEEAAAAAARHAAWQNRRNVRSTKGGLEPNIQGCLLLQALVRLPSPSNEVIFESLSSQSIDTLINYATNPISSRFLDSVLESPNGKYKRRLISSFLGKYETLAVDRIGSRVAEKLFEHADGFMKEKIARSVLPEATTIGNNEFGKYFIRRLHLHLLDRRPAGWREAVNRKPGVPTAFSVPATTLGSSTSIKYGINKGLPEKRSEHEKMEDRRRDGEAEMNVEKAGVEVDTKKVVKEKRRKESNTNEEDEIDMLFAGVEKKRKKSRI